MMRPFSSLRPPGDSAWWMRVEHIGADGDLGVVEGVFAEHVAGGQIDQPEHHAGRAQVHGDSGRGPRCVAGVDAGQDPAVAVAEHGAAHAVVGLAQTAAAAA